MTLVLILPFYLLEEVQMKTQYHQLIREEIKKVLRNPYSGAHIVISRHEGGMVKVTMRKNIDQEAKQRRRRIQLQLAELEDMYQILGAWARVY